EISGSRGWMAYRLPKITSEAITSARLARRKAGDPRAISSGAGVTPDMGLLVLFEGAQGKGGDTGVLHQAAAAQIGQVDDGSSFVYLRAQLIDQLGCGQKGASGSDQIIDYQDLVAFLQRIAVHFDTGLAVL